MKFTLLNLFYVTTVVAALTVAIWKRPPTRPTAKEIFYLPASSGRVTAGGLNRQAVQDRAVAIDYRQMLDRIDKSSVGYQEQMVRRALLRAYRQLVDDPRNDDLHTQIWALTWTLTYMRKQRLQAR